MECARSGCYARWRYRCGSTDVGEWCVFSGGPVRGVPIQGECSCPSMTQMLRMCFQTVGSSVVLCYPVAQVRMLRLFVLGLCGDVGLSGGGWPVVVRNMFVIKSSHCAGVEVHRPMHTASPDAHSKTDAHSRPTHSRTDTQWSDHWGRETWVVVFDLFRPESSQQGFTFRLPCRNGQG